MRSFIVAGLAVLSSGCATMTGAPVAIESDSITYEANPCFGTCPVYRVTVSPDGRGTFEGRAHTAVRDIREFRVTPAQYQAFERQLAPLRPAQGEVRLSGSEACRVYASDLPSVTVTWTRQIGDSQVYHLDFGCDGERNGPARERLQAAPNLLPIQAFIGARR